jgi:hypothetical protein
VLSSALVVAHHDGPFRLRDFESSDEERLRQNIGVRDVATMASVPLAISVE